MQYLNWSSSDSEEYIEKINRIIIGSSNIYKPEVICIIKIDNWFGEKWLKFSYKAMGAFGVASNALIVPPFVPERVISEDVIVLAEGEYHEDKIFSQPIHISQSSKENQNRKIGTLFPTTGFYWWSRNTSINNQGCLMAYLPTREGHLAWYLGFEQNDNWRFSKSLGISKAELTSYEKTT